jgi:hypothetical protein
VLSTSGVSADLVAAVLDEADTWPAAGRNTVNDAAAENPAAPLERAERWLRGEQPRTATAAAANPAFFDIASGLRDQLDPHVAAHICANRAATADYLAAHFEDSVRNAARNRNLSAHDISAMLQRFWAGGHTGAVEVYANPSLPADIRARELTNTNEHVRLCIAANPAATDSQLHTLRCAGGAVARRAGRAIGLRGYRRAPLDAPLTYIDALHPSQIHPELIAAVADLDDTAHAAAASMLAAGFAGTMAELIDVAAGVTDS